MIAAKKNKGESLRRIAGRDMTAMNLNQLRPSKDSAIKAAINLTPKYVELLREFQTDGGRLPFTPEISNIQNHLGQYVLIYDDERKIGRALMLFLMGKEGYDEFVAEITSASSAERQDFVEEFSDPDNNQLAEMFDSIQIPQSKEEWRAAKEELDKLPEDERAETIKRGTYFWSFLFSTFFNTLALMVHGSRMTTLVPQAMAGDDDAFLKAIQIDRMLLLHHHYFRDRKFRAQNEGDLDFLAKIAYRESNPPLRSKVKYPGLYMLFGILEVYRWLPDIRHDEILDICDAAELDRYQNRVEDVNYLTKRLIEYRKWQKTGGVSMH